MVLELQTRGLSAAALELLALLPDVPLTWLSDAAAGALLGRPVPDTRRVLAELTRAGLLVAVTPSRHRVPREARALGLPAGDRAPAALARLVGHYAGEATQRLVTLTVPGRPDRSGSEREAEAWFRREDLALLALLERPALLPRSAAPRLALLADALEVWFTRDGRPADRRAAAEAALAAAAVLADMDGQLTALLRLAAVARSEGELDEAADHLRRARELGAGTEDARLVTGLGQQALAIGDPAGARQEFERNLSRRPRRDAVGRVIDQVDLGAVLIVQGQLDRAVRLLQEAAVLAQDAGDPAGVAYAQELLGVVAAHRAEPAAALAVWAEAQLRFEQLHDDQGQARCLLHRGTLLAATEPGTAAEMLRASLALRGTQTTGVGVALARLQLADHVAAGGDLDAAAWHRAEALAALAPWEGRIDPPADVAALRRRLATADCEE
jgi:tetratricopeptide (TPR) repeat protein